MSGSVVTRDTLYLLVATDVALWLLINPVIGRRYEILSSASHLPQNYLEVTGFVQHDRKTSLLLRTRRQYGDRKATELGSKLPMEKMILFSDKMTHQEV